MVVVIEISEKSLGILKLIKEAKVAEFLDTEYQSLEEFKESYSYKNGHLSEKFFTNRNFCNLKDLNELIAAKLIEPYGRPWETQYVISDIGKKFLERLKPNVSNINYN